MVDNKPKILSLEDVLVETVNKTALETLTFDPDNKIPVEFWKELSAVLTRLNQKQRRRAL